MQKLTFIGIIICTWAACKNAETKSQKQYNGYVVWEEGYTVFTDCNTGKEYWLQDTTGGIAKNYKKISAKPYQMVFFTLEANILAPATKGAAAAYGNIMQVTKIINNAITAPANACAAKNNTFAFECSGDAPEWNLSFGQDIKFTSKFPNDTIVYFPLQEPLVRDSARVGKVFYYYIPNENYQHIELIVTENPCQAKNGSQNRFTAKVMFGGNQYTGCAKLKTTTTQPQ